MNAKPEITDGEIQSYMDFDKLLKQRAAATALRRRRLVKGIGFGTLAIASLLAVWFFYQPSEQALPAEATRSEVPYNVQTLPKTIPDTLSFSGSKSSQDDQQIVEHPPFAEKNKMPGPIIGKSGKPAEADTLTAKNEPAPNVISVFAQAEPVDGYPALYAYFNQALTYPPEAMADSVEGVVTVVFSINAEGRPEKIYIEQSLGEPFDREAIRVIENMPLWKPAAYNGKPVPSKISLPLTFQIKKVKTQ